MWLTSVLQYLSVVSPKGCRVFLSPRCAWHSAPAWPPCVRLHSALLFIQHLLPPPLLLLSLPCSLSLSCSKQAWSSFSCCFSSWALSLPQCSIIILSVSSCCDRRCSLSSCKRCRSRAWCLFSNEARSSSHCCLSLLSLSSLSSSTACSVSLLISSSSCLSRSHSSLSLLSLSSSTACNTFLLFSSKSCLSHPHSPWASFPAQHTPVLFYAAAPQAEHLAPPHSSFALLSTAP